MNKLAPTSLIFDLDDTLIPSSQFYLPAVSQVLLHDRLMLQHFESARQKVKSDMPILHTSARNRLLYFKRMIEIADRPDISALKLTEQYEFELARLIGNWSKSHGRLALIRKLQDRYPSYILTNETVRTQLLKIDAMCLGEEHGFRGIICSEEAGFEKPSSRIFQILFERFGLRPQDCLMIGDSLKNDIEPASNLGLRAILTEEFSEKKLDRQSLPIINHLSELLDILT